MRILREELSGRENSKSMSPSIEHEWVAQGTVETSVSGTE